MVKRDFYKSTPSNQATPFHRHVAVSIANVEWVRLFANEGDGTKYAHIDLTPGQAESLARYLIVAAEVARENARG